MPRLSFEPAREQAAISLSNRDGETPASGVTANGISWALKLRQGGRVRLSTGGDLRELEGSVYLRVGDATPDGKAIYEGDDPIRWGGLHYLAADSDDDQSYYIDLHISQSQFDRVQRLVELGSVPVLNIDLGDDSLFKKDGEAAIKYGWEPDGSGKEWDNKNHQHLPIKGFTFIAKVGVSDDTEDDENGPRADLRAPTRRDLNALGESFRKFQSQAIVLGWIIAGLLAVIVFR
jgi:hypothetical protein